MDTSSLSALSYVAVLDHHFYDGEPPAENYLQVVMNEVAGTLERGYLFEKQGTGRLYAGIAELEMEEDVIAFFGVFGFVEVLEID